jgi:hypothetical protein
MWSDSAEPSGLQQLGTQLDQAGPERCLGISRVKARAGTADAFTFLDVGGPWGAFVPGRAPHPVRVPVVPVRLQQLGTELGQPCPERCLGRCRVLARAGTADSQAFLDVGGPWGAFVPGRAPGPVGDAAAEPSGL